MFASLMSLFQTDRKRWFREYRRKYRVLHPGYGGKDRRLLAMRKIAKDHGEKELKCVYCGCDEPSILEINHINGGGGKETKRGAKMPVFYWDIIKERRSTSDLEIACRVCNTLHYLRLRYPQANWRFTIVWSRNSQIIEKETTSLIA